MLRLSILFLVVFGVAFLGAAAAAVFLPALLDVAAGALSPVGTLGLSAVASAAAVIAFSARRAGGGGTLLGVVSLLAALALPAVSVLPIVMPGFLEALAAALERDGNLPDIFQQPTDATGAEALNRPSVASTLVLALVALSLVSLGGAAAGYRGYARLAGLLFVLTLIGGFGSERGSLDAIMLLPMTGLLGLLAMQMIDAEPPGTPFLLVAAALVLVADLGVAVADPLDGWRSSTPFGLLVLPVMGLLAARARLGRAGRGEWPLALGIAALIIALQATVQAASDSPLRADFDQFAALLDPRSIGLGVVLALSFIGALAFLRKTRRPA